MADDSQFTDVVTNLMRPTLMAVFGETVTYTPDGGAAVAITAAVQDVTKAVQDTENGRSVVTGCTLVVSTADVTPAIKDQVVVRGVTLMVVDIPENDAGMARLELVAPDRYEESRAGLRQVVR